MVLSQKSRRSRRVGVIGGIASLLIISGGLVWWSIGGPDSNMSGDPKHPLGTLDATELAAYNADATTDASP